MFIAATHELEEQLGTGAGDGEVADLIDDHQTRRHEGAEATREMAGLLRIFEPRDQIGERRVVHAAPALRGDDRETDGQMRLADAGGPEEDDILLALEELEGVQALELIALHGRLKGEVEVVEGPHGRQARTPHRRLEATLIAERDMATEEGLHGGARRELPRINAAQNLIDRFEGAGHLAVGELGPEAIP